MKEIKLGIFNKTSVKLYQEIDEQPITLHNLFNEYGLMDSEIGNSMAAVEAKYGNLATYLARKDNEKAMQEINNLYQTLWSAINRINYKSLQFGCIVYSIDGIPVTDYSQEALTVMLETLSRKGLNMKIVKEEIDNLKKKFQAQLELIFPEKFNAIGIMNFNSHIRSRLLSKLNWIVTEEQKYLDSLKVEEDYLYGLMSPKNLNGNDVENILYKSKKQFESLCVSLLAQGMPDPEKMTVMRFFSTIKYYEDKKAKSKTK